MVYDDGTGTPIYVPLSGRRPVPEGLPEPTEATYEAIRRVAADHPHWGPRRIFAELRITRHDIPLDVVEMVAANLKSALRGRGRSDS